jgi:5-(carboxyamino)imidazole ribonucleotide synthase
VATDLSTGQYLHQPKVPLAPGSWLGMLGGGQLGRMFCFEAHSLGYKVCVLDPDKQSPAGAVADKHIYADYLDPIALKQLADLCQAVTTEFENVPAAALEQLAARVIVSPAAACVTTAQNRIAEKAFFKQAGIACAPYVVIESATDLAKVTPGYLPGILKSARLGYDGKGQIKVASQMELVYGWHTLKQTPCVLEKRLDLAQELSVLVARGFDGAMAVFPVAQNVHHNGILAKSVHPAPVSAGLFEQATQAAKAIAQTLNYVGLLCIEFFVLADGSLVANEMAPRPHNSGHYTIDACWASQFEQQVRAMAGLPLASTHQHSCAVMLNLLGDAWLVNGTACEPDWAFVLKHPQAKLHLYGKTEPRLGRKMGHITIVGDQAQAIADSVSQHLRLPV